MEHHLCLQWIEGHLIDLNQQYEQCTKDLLEQEQLSSSFLAKYDEKLKDFVQIQQKYWSLRLQSHLNRYQSLIQERNLYHHLMMHPSNAYQVNLV